MPWKSFWPLPLLICKLHSNSEKPDSYHLPSIHLIIQFQYTCIVVLEFLTYTFIGKKTVSSKVWWACTASFAFSLTDSAHFQSSLGYHLPSFLSVKSFRTFVTQLFCHIMCSILGFLDLLNESVFNFDTLRSTLCYEFP